MIRKLVCDWCSCASPLSCHDMSKEINTQFRLEDIQFVINTAKADQSIPCWWKQLFYWSILCDLQLITDWSFKTQFKHVQHFYVHKLRSELINNRSLPVKTWRLKHCWGKKAASQSINRSVDQSISRSVDQLMAAGLQWVTIRAVKKATSRQFTYGGSEVPETSKHKHFNVSDWINTFDQAAQPTRSRLNLTFFISIQKLFCKIKVNSNIIITCLTQSSELVEAKLNSIF